MKFVVYEVWTRSRIIDADDTHEAYNEGEPVPIDGLSLCNWHVVPVDQYPTEEPPAIGGLNYRQV